jgi:hypothetical protein
MSNYPDTYADFRSEGKFKKKGTKERLFSRIVFKKTPVHRKKSETSIKFWTICTFLHENAKSGIQRLNITKNIFSISVSGSHSQPKTV